VVTDEHAVCPVGPGLSTWDDDSGGTVRSSQVGEAGFVVAGVEVGGGFSPGVVFPVYGVLGVLVVCGGVATGWGAVRGGGLMYFAAVLRLAADMIAS
jgi:hypothetical protein